MKDGLPRTNLKLGFLNNIDASCRVVAVHSELDSALLVQEGENVCKAPPNAWPSPVTGNQGLSFVGYSPKKSDNRGSVVEVNRIEKYEIEERQRSDTETLLHFKAEYAENGNSGGPILESGGSVVSIIIQKYEEDNIRYCRATDIKVLLKNLEFGEKWKINPSLQCTKHNQI